MARLRTPTTVPTPLISPSPERFIGRLDREFGLEDLSSSLLFTGKILVPVKRGFVLIDGPLSYLTSVQFLVTCTSDFHLQVHILR